MLIVVLFAGAFFFTGFRAGSRTIAYDLAFAPPSALVLLAIRRRFKR